MPSKRTNKYNLKEIICKYHGIFKIQSPKLKVVVILKLRILFVNIVVYSSYLIYNVFIYLFIYLFIFN